MKTWGIYPYMLPYASLLSQVNLNALSKVHVQVVSQAHDGLFQVVLGTESGRTQYYDVSVEDGKGEVEIHDVEKECIRISIANACGEAIDPLHEYHVTYYIDGNISEETHASLLVSDALHEVLIVLEPIQQFHFLLQKVTKTAFETQCEASNAVFTYVLTGPNFHECITLSQENNWQKEYCLCPGVYELIDENEYAGCVSYCLNETAAKKRFVLEAHSMMVITEQKQMSLLSIRFEEHTNPCMIDVHITSQDGCYDEWVTLCEANDYMVELEDLSYGLYSVQVKDDQFAYRVNMCHVSEHYALVQMDHDAQVVELLEMSCIPDALQGNLKIRKWIQDEYGLEVKPDADEAFMVKVYGCGKEDVYYLNASNCWSVEIGIACAGTYHIEELCDDGYESRYRIDCGALQSDACVMLDPCTQTLVEIVNKRKATAKLCISQYILNEEGCYTRPKQSDIYYYTVRGFDYRQMITLDCENHWQCILDGLCPGCYEIKEHGCADEVGYKINGGEWCCHGRICLDEADVVQVGIYHHKKQIKHGCMRIQKWISTSEGELMQPDMTKRYEFIVESEQQMFTICLHAGNHFEMILDELEAGCYQIKELGGNPVYRIDGECVQGDACVMVCGDEHEVIVMNEDVPKAALHICAQQVDGCGNEIPLEKDVHVCVDSMMYHEEIVLNQDNDWCCDIIDLPPGTYHIMQTDEDTCQVRYIVNGINRPYANVVLKQEDVCVILRQQLSCPSSKVQIRQFMSDHDTRFVPESGSFEVRLYHRYYDTCVILNEENGYCAELHDLPNDQYYIEAQGAVIYVNGTCVEHRFCLSEDSQIDVVNPCERKCRVCFEQQVLDENGCELPLDACYQYQLFAHDETDYFELSCENGYEHCFLLPNGVYELVSESGEFDLCINGKEVINHHFSLKDCPLSIQIRHHVTLHHTLCVEKWIRQNGSLQRPCPQECFTICLYDEKKETRYATLDQSNQWCAVFDELEQGHYEIKEAMDESYDASFVIDGKEQELGCIEMGDCDVDVMLINTKIEDTNDLVSFTLSKRIDGKGMPDQNEEYLFQLKGAIETTLVLNGKNRFEAQCEVPKGNYQLSEIGNEHVSYFVDGKAVDGNQIAVLQDMNVVALNEMKQTDNVSLSVSVCGRNGEVLPLTVEEVTILIEGVGVSEKVTLSKQQGFHQTIALRNGRYEIIAPSLEQYASVAYRINGGNLIPHVLCYIGHTPVEIEIVYLEAACGSMTISKYVQSPHCNCLMKPSGNEVYQVAIRHDETRTITLSAANHYSETLYDFRNGVYEIEELGDYDTTYFVDGVEMETATVSMNGEHHQIQIVNRSHVSGSITLQKQLRRSDGMLVDPDASDVFTFQLEGPLNRMMILDHANQFTMQVSDLPNGLYHLREQGEQMVQYVINGEVQAEASFYIQNHHFEIMAINETVSEQGSITLRKQIRDENGNFTAPSANDSFDFFISAPNYQNMVTLNAGNAFQVTLKDLASGIYVISEQGQKASYIIDHGFEVDYANVNVKQEHHDVLAINESVSKNSLYLSKYLRDRSSALSKPVEGSYEVLITAPGYNERFVLEESNGWELKVELENGQYVVEELGDYDTVYIVDGQNEVRYANVLVSNDSHEIQIINEVDCGGGSLLLTKYVKSKDGEWVRPQASDRFDVAVSSESFYQIYTLDVNNLFTETIDNLPPGIYEVKETGVSNGMVYYVVDSGAQSDQATVAIDANAHTVRILNENSSSQSAIQLMKYIKRNDMYQKPADHEVFTIRISGAYNTEIVLDASNHWDYTVTGLPQGTYRVEEVSGGYTNVSYSLNGGNPLPICEFTIVSNTQYLVGIINEEQIIRQTTSHHTTPVKVVLS